MYEYKSLLELLDSPENEPRRKKAHGPGVTPVALAPSASAHESPGDMGTEMRHTAVAVVARDRAGEACGGSHDRMVEACGGSRDRIIEAGPRIRDLANGRAARPRWIE